MGIEELDQLGEVGQRPRQPVYLVDDDDAWELRSATSLARLWQLDGRVAEARTLLTEVYGRFTEGFATRDLIEAKALIETLQRVC
jgi:predicted ATPase